MKYMKKLLDFSKKQYKVTKKKRHLQKKLA